MAPSAVFCHHGEATDSTGKQKAHWAGDGKIWIQLAARLLASFVPLPQIWSTRRMKEMSPSILITVNRYMILRSSWLLSVNGSPKLIPQNCPSSPDESETSLYPPPRNPPHPSQGDHKCSHPRKLPYLSSCRTATKVPGNKEVDNRPTDSLRSQDEGQRPPKAQHLSYGCISLR